MPTRNINLTDHFDRFIEAEVGAGRFGNASEVVRDGLRLLEQRAGRASQTEVAAQRRKGRVGPDRSG